MKFFELLIELIRVISFDILAGFLIWTLYRYIDYKYFSELEIVTLRKENIYLKRQNRDLNGTSTFFDEEDKLWFRVYQVYLVLARTYMQHI